MPSPATDISHLGYEQLRALQLIQATPNQHFTVICQGAQCSWDELLDLIKTRLLTIGTGTCLYLTPAGEAALAAAIAAGILDT